MESVVQRGLNPASRIRIRIRPCRNGIGNELGGDSHSADHPRSDFAVCDDGPRVARQAGRMRVAAAVPQACAQGENSCPDFRVELSGSPECSDSVSKSWRVDMVTSPSSVLSRSSLLSWFAVPRFLTSASAPPGTDGSTVLAQGGPWAEARVSVLFL